MKHRNKLPVVSSRDMIKFLTTKGFKIVGYKGDHTILENGDRKTQVPQRTRLNKHNIMNRLADCNISREEFLEGI